MEFFTSAIDTLKVLVIALALACGALSTCWKVTATTTLARMLMCDKVTHKTFIDSSPLFLNLSDTVFIKSASKLR